MLTYLEIARRLRPRWVVWENVPGVLSSGRGRDFGSFLGALGELGYGWAYRVLDAQWVRTQRHPRAVPQRRRRVFVVGCLGDAAAAAAVLFERESVCRDPAPRGAPRQGAAADAESCSGTVSSKWAKGTGAPAGDECYNLTVDPIVIDRAAFNQGEHAQYDPIVRHDDAMPSMVARGPHAVAFPIDGRNAMRHPEKLDEINRQGMGTGESFDPSHTLTKACVHAVAHGFYSTGGTHGVNMTPELSPAVKVGSGLGIPSPPAVAFTCKDYGADAGTVSPTMRAMPHDGSHANGGGQLAMAHAMTVRRLTPRECERLQAFPDDYTMIPWRGKSAADCPDGPRYKALGNSMAVNCMEWIGERIAAYEEARP
jgi:DNA (cytosine-5)-methyltransferase 1